MRPDARREADPAPLTARSVILSVLLGSHPPALPVRSIVRIAELFGISEGTLRVALSRLSADGDVLAADGIYRLHGRLVERQAAQDAALRPPLRPWRGRWEIAVILAHRGPTAPAAGLSAELRRRGLAELRSGTWVRPDNLRRAWDDAGLGGGVWHCTGADPGPGWSDSEMVGHLWDLAGWAEGAEALIARMSAAATPAERFVTAAAMVRHLRADPLLPPALLPAHWPGRRLRRSYDAYRRELGTLLERERVRAEPGRVAQTATATSSGREARARHRAV